MRILFLNHNVVRAGGTFYRAYHVARHLVQRGHNVTLLTISKNRAVGFGREVSNGVETIETPDLLWGMGRTGWDPWDTLNRVIHLRSQRWDIVHGWDCRPVVILPALYAHWRSGQRARLVLDWCDWWGRGGAQAERPHHLSMYLYGPVETFFEESFRTCAQGTTVSGSALSQRACRLGVRPDTIFTLHGGSDTQAIVPMDFRRARTQIRLPADGPIVGFMGALSVPDAQLLIDALRLARKEIPELKFLAIGLSLAGTNRPAPNILNLQNESWVIETGRIPFDQVCCYLNACDLLALPLRNTISNSARWPSKINDYFASGRPVLATAVGEIRRFGEQAHLTADDVLSFRDGMLRILQDPEYARQIGAAGRSLAEGELNWSNIVANLEQFYGVVLD